VSGDAIAATLRRIGALDEAAMTAARARQRELTKPEGSLGRLEDLAVQVAGIVGAAVPELPRKAVIVVAADHGVAVEGVSAYPSEVTAQMVANFLSGGAAINALARAAGARVVVVDAGVAGDVPSGPALYSRKIARGTRNLRRAPAMSRDQAREAVFVGTDVLECEAARGLDLVATGDMGIGNTTPASAIVAAICGTSVAEVTGRGTGIDDETLARKIAVIEDALRLHRPDSSDALDVLAKIGGFEIGVLAGVIIDAAARRIPIVLDGFISGAAALIANGLDPKARDFMIAAHRSAERGHRAALDQLALEPLLDLRLRLGEGTGAVLAMLLIDAALAAHREMATFAGAGVSDREGGSS